MFGMQRLGKIGLALGVALGLGVMGTAPRSDAFVLTLDDISTSGIDVIIVDDSAIGTPTNLGPLGASTNPDGTSGTGIITYNGAVGSFIVNVTTGISKPLIGSSTSARLDLNSINVSGTAGTIELMLTDTNYLLVNQPSPPDFTFLSEVGGTTDGAVELWQTLDKCNNQFGIAGSIPGDCAPDTVVIHQGAFGPGAFAGTQSVLTPLGLNPFSLSQTVRITHTSAGDVTSLDALATTSTPEPGTMVLLATGLAGLVGYGWRRKQQDVA